MEATARISKSPQHQNPLPADPTGVKFCSYFQHPWKCIVAPNPNSDSRPSWRTEKYYLAPRNLWQMHQNPSLLLGLRFDDTTRYALIDIDKGSPHHPHNDEQKFKLVVQSFEKIGLVRPLIVQSSWSEGIHIYFFLPEAVSTFDLACALKVALLDEGFYIKQGEIEIFPNVKVYKKKGCSNYNAHRLPLQPSSGSYLLDDNYQPLTDDIAKYLKAADWAASGQAMDELRQALAIARDRHKFAYNNSSGSNRALEWREHLEARNAIGWTGKGQTNELLKDFGTYGRVWLGLSSQELIDYIVTSALNAPGYKQYCSHKHEIGQRARAWAGAVERYYSPYCSYPERKGNYSENFDGVANDSDNVIPFPSNQVNEQRQAQALARIEQAIAYLKENGELPDSPTARANAINITAKKLTGIGVSQLTLYKQSYLPLWHPNHEDKRCRIDRPEQVSDNVVNLNSINSEAPENSTETPQPLTTEASSSPPCENFIPPVYMKVLLVGPEADAPQGQSASLLLNRGEREGGFSTANAVDSEPQQPHQTPKDEPANERAGAPLRIRVERWRDAWQRTKNPDIKNKIRKLAESTPGVVMTPDGPFLENELIGIPSSTAPSPVVATTEPTTPPVSANSEADEKIWLGLELGLIRKLDPLYKGLWDRMDNWYKLSDWLAEWTLEQLQEMFQQKIKTESISFQANEDSIEDKDDFF